MYTVVSALVDFRFILQNALLSGVCYGNMVVNERVICIYVCGLPFIIDFFFILPFYRVINKTHNEAKKNIIVDKGLRIPLWYY